MAEAGLWEGENRRGGLVSVRPGPKMDGDFLDGNPMDHGEVPDIFQEYHDMSMMEAWNKSYKFLNQFLE